MITVFNRKELILTQDMKRQAEVRQILSDAGIDYIFRTKNVSFSGGPMGRTGQPVIEYRIYVRRKDYEEASFLIRK